MAYTTRWGDGVRLLLAALLLAVLSGCGWRLAGSGLDQKPLGAVYMQAQSGLGGGTSGVLAGILAFTRDTTIVNKAEDADLHIIIMADVTQRRIVALSGAGRVREIELVLNVRFAVRDRGVYILPANDIQFRQVVSYDDAQALGREAEIALLINTMQQDAATQILRRIYAIRK